MGDLTSSVSLTTSITQFGPSSQRHNSSIDTIILCGLGKLKPHLHDDKWPGDTQLFNNWTVISIQCEADISLLSKNVFPVIN